VTILSQLLMRYQHQVNKKREKLYGRKLNNGEELSNVELSKRTDLSNNIITSIMEVRTKNPRNESLKKIVAVFIEENVIYDVEKVREIWEAAGREGQEDETWFNDTVKETRKNIGTKPFVEEYPQERLDQLFVRNNRDITLFEAIENAGLVDIENRNDRERSLPPEQFYEMAKYEVVITAITAHQTITRHDDLLQQLLEHSIYVYLLILRPDSDLIAQENLYEREKLDIVKEINSVMDSIHLQKLDQCDNFEVKFLPKWPPFTAVMIDGDVDAKRKKAHDTDGQIRVQPTTAYGTQHRGAVFQFKKKDNNPWNLFDFFAEDVRKQWQHSLTWEEVLKGLKRE
jgi:hypothetical protein